MPWVGSAPPCGDQVPIWGHGPCTYPWWWRALLFASLEQELPLYHPPVTGMLVWHVGTRPHVAHRQSFRWADYLDRLSSLNFGLAVLMCLWPFGSGRMTNAAMRWGILHLQRQGVAGWKAGLHLTRRCPASATQPPCANYSRLLVMRKSCKMDTGWASSWVLLSIPLRLQHTLRHLRCDWDDWHSSLLPWSAQTVPFCSCTMALADSCGAGSCSQLAELASSPSLHCSPVHPGRYR